jgi:1,4-alpha-glucan branching enzyme
VKPCTIPVLAAVLAAGGCATHYHVINSGHVEMFLTAPQAQSVVLVVSSDPFQQVQALRDDSGIWKATLNRLSEFKYFYLVDGKTYLPDCHLREHDDFGSNNCVFSPRAYE